MQRKSMHGIVADLSRSHGAYVYDTRTGREVLDLHGLYSSLPLGYGHPALSQPSTYADQVSGHIGVKLSLCETTTPEVLAARDAFMAASPDFAWAHFTSTGALAVEAAMKVAYTQTRPGPSARVAGLADGFHGIYGMAAGLSGSPVGRRLEGLPVPSVGVVVDDHGWDGVVSRVVREVEGDGLAAVLVEPIQCSAGDVVVPGTVLRELRAVCDAHGVPLVFDEIQTGFGATGTLWHYQQLGVVPDLLVFGKRAQVSGVLVRPGFGRVLDSPARLETTWDGDAIDLLRCAAILRVYDEEDVLGNVTTRGQSLRSMLSAVGVWARGVGMTLAFDMDDRATRDQFVERLWRDHAVAVLPTGERTVRLRPPLTLDGETANAAVDRMVQALEAEVVV